MRRAVALAAVAAVLLAAPAAADDEDEIDVRLQDAGFADAFTWYANADDGVRVSVEYDTDAADEAGYRAEAAQAAEVVWDHLELRVLAVDVTPTSSVSWLDGDLPPAVSFSRSQLQQQFGARPAALDAETSSFYADEEAGLAFAGIAALAVLLVGAGLGFLVGWLVGRRRPPQPAWGSGPGWGAGPPGPGQQAGGWGAPPAWPQPSWPQPGGWPQPGAAPGPWPQPGSPPSPTDPWRPS